MTTKPLSWLGLARRAGKLALGRQACREAFERGSAVLLVVAEDAPASVMRYWRERADRAHVQLIVTGTRASLGAAAGVGQLVVAAVCDEGLASHFAAAVIGPVTSARSPADQE